MVCIQTIMCYTIKVNNDLPDQRSVDVNVYFSFINLIFLCVYVFAGACAWMCTTMYINMYNIYMSIYDLTYKNTQLKALYREAFNIDVYGFWKFQQLQKSSRRFS